MKREEIIEEFNQASLEFAEQINKLYDMIVDQPENVKEDAEMWVDSFSEYLLVIDKWERQDHFFNLSKEAHQALADLRIRTKQLFEKYNQRLGSL